MVSESADKDNMGKAFGIHKALDMAGSAIGILLAFILVSGVSGDFEYKSLFLISMVPMILGLFMFTFVREKKDGHVLEKRESFWKNIKRLDSQLKLYLVVAFVFTLGNSSNTFLLLRAKSVGFDDTTVILLYFVYNVTASVLAIPCGRMSDKVGRKILLVSGYIVFTLVYLGLAFAFNKLFMISMFILYGVYTAIITGVERAFIAEISPKELKGTMLGLHATIVGIALFPASMIAGLLWSFFGARIPFIFGAAMSLGVAGILLLLMKSINYRTIEKL